MTCHLHAVTFDANDPLRLATFWAGVLGREVTDETGDGLTLPPDDDAGFVIRFLPTSAKSTGPNQIHLDLTSTSPADMRQTVSRVLELGGRHIDIGQTPEEGHVVLADPEGNALCIIPPGNHFLADTALIGAVNCDGTQEVGYFWSAALGWPLVWDQDQETAIQSPQGGSKMAWGGPPVNPKAGKNRLHLDIVPAVGDAQQQEVQRLVALGASYLDVGQGDVSWTVMADPDGNEFCVLAPGTA